MNAMVNRVVNGARIHFLGCLMLLGVCVGAWAQPEKTAEVDGRTTDTVVAKASWGNITLGELKKYYEHYLVPTNTVSFSPVVDPSEVMTMPADWLEKLAMTYAIARASEVLADKVEDPELKTSFERQFNGWLMNYVLPEVDKQLVMPKAGEPSEEEILEYYERNKALYFQPFQFSMRHIFMQTYEPYVLQKNETLEGVAQRLLGDKARVGEILSDVAGRPVRWVPPEERRQRFYKPEFAGEQVLIPMSPEKMEEVRQRMEKIRERAHKGENFSDLALEYSQAEIRGGVIGPLPSGIAEERMLQIPIVEAAMETPKDGISKVIPTKHGYHLIKVVSKREEKMPTLEESRKKIYDDIMTQRRDKFREEAILELVKQPVVEVNMENFAKAPDLAKDALMIKVGAHPFYWGDIENIWGRFIGPGADRDLIVNGMRAKTEFVHAAMLEWAKSSKLWETPEYADTYKYLRTGTYGLALNRMELDKTVRAAITPEALQEYYDARKDSDYYQPLTGTYHIMARRVEPAKAGDQKELDRMRLELDKELAGIRNINDFITYAKKTNPPPDKGSRWAFIVPVEIDTVSGPTGEKLKGLQSGQWSSAYIEGDTVRSVVMIERSESRRLSLIEVQKSISEAISKRVEGETKGLLEQHWLRDSQFEFLLPKSATPAPPKAESP